VKFVAGQVKVDPAMFAGYAWSSRTAGYHRAQIRAVLGFREPVAGDEDKLADWLAAEVCPAEPNRVRLHVPGGAGPGRRGRLQAAIRGKASWSWPGPEPVTTRPPGQPGLSGPTLAGR
jgi:hypothetical protein